MNEDEPPDHLPKKHPAEDFLRATKDARASRLAGMPAVTSGPSIGRENRNAQPDLIPDKRTRRRKWIVLLTIAAALLSIFLIVRFVGIQSANRRLAPIILSAELSPENAFRWTLLGDAYAKEGRLFDAEAAYKKAIKLSGGNYGLTGLGQLYEQQGRLDEAIASFEKALMIKPRLHGANLFLAVAYYKLNRFDHR